MVYEKNFRFVEVFDDLVNKTFLIKIFDLVIQKEDRDLKVINHHQFQKKIIGIDLLKIKVYQNELNFFRIVNFLLDSTVNFKTKSSKLFVLKNKKSDNFYGKIYFTKLLFVGEVVVFLVVKNYFFTKVIDFFMQILQKTLMLLILHVFIVNLYQDYENFICKV